MIGIVITGHNHFASGITSSVEMVGGKQKYLEVVDFEENMNEVDLTNKLKEAIERLGACEKIIICCDLMGGSPFKMAATLAVENSKIKVLYGVNLGMLLEMVLSREFNDDVDLFINNLIDAGKQAIGLFEYKEYKEEEIEEGI